MNTVNVREQIHQLVDTANEDRLNAVLEMLQPSSSRYTKEELDSFYTRVEQFETNKSKGYSVEESHALIRSKYKQHVL